MAQKSRIISGYSHLNLPPERWTARVPALWRDRVPLPNGGDMIMMEDWSPRALGRTRMRGRSYDQLGIAARFYDGPGTGSPAQRLREQDEDGVDAEIMYTHLYSSVFLAMVASQDGDDPDILYTHPLYSGFWRGIREDDGYKALIRAYNEFLTDEYCAASPSRLIAIGVIPDTGVDDAIKEIEYCARAGLKGVALHRFPSGKGYPTPEDDRFWQAALDTNMPITSHAQGGTTTFTQEGPLVQDVRRPGASPGGWDPVSMLPRFAGGQPIAPLQMAYAGVFDRFPRLRIYWAGSQAGWLRALVSQIDDVYEQHPYWGERVKGTEPMAHPPSYYLKTHCLWGFVNDPLAVRMRHDVGVGHLIWGSDFGNAARRSRRSVDVVSGCFAGVPEDERFRMLAGNVIEFFHLDQEETIETEQTAAANAR